MRYPGPDLDLDDLFLFEAKRRVMKDRTVSLHGRLYEVDAILVGHSIIRPNIRVRFSTSRNKIPPASEVISPPSNRASTPRESNS